MQQDSGGGSSAASSPPTPTEVNEDLLQLDNARLRILTLLLPPTPPQKPAAAAVVSKEDKIKKIQRHFQALGQNLVAYDRSYRSILALADKLDAVLSRIDSLEVAVTSTFAQMEAAAEDFYSKKSRREASAAAAGEAAAEHPIQAILRRVKGLMTVRMEEIEVRLSGEIHECMEPSAGFVQRKRKQRESDSFLNFITHFDLI
jgi:hypothetical protein